MRILITILFLFSAFTGNSQPILKENLTKKVSFYYDKNKIKLQSQGCYYKDELGETTEKHGKWKYYDELGVLEEERDYYRDLLNGKVVAYYPSKIIKQEGHFKNNRQDSVFTEWHENGNLKLKGTYNMEKPIGRWEYYYFDGRVKSIEEIVDGTVLVEEFYLPDSLHTQLIIDGTGELLVYYNTGSLKEYYQYKDGLKDGTFEEYSIYNYPLLTGSFKKGKKEGKWNYYFFTGDLHKTIDYSNEKMNGEYVVYYDNGVKKIEGAYQNDLKAGKWTWKTNKGTVDMEGFFSDDLQDGKWLYNYPTGELSYTAQYKKGKKDGNWNYFYKNGKLSKEGSFENDEKEGEWKTWYEDGVLLMKGSYSKGKENGEWVNFWENGKLKNRSTFKEGTLNGLWESYHQNGKLSLQGTYKDDHKAKQWITFYDNGLPAELATYKVFNVKSKINYSILKDFDRVESQLHGKFIRYSQKDFQKSEEGKYKHNQKTGEWIAYQTGGTRPAVISNYKKGELSGWMKQYDKSGVLVSEVEYKDGLKDGRFLVYDRNGKVVSEKLFKEGVQVVEGGKSFAPGR
ncbi:MAG: hypothetical protein KJ941_13490 [Bacteroidetes bacterium]|nr:hypothetical protein [Bacteroidota bacterium]